MEKSEYTVKVLSEGYARLEEGMMRANCTCSLITGPGIVMIVDTMTAWDKDFLLKALEEEGIRQDQVTHCIATHGHYDHIGNMNLFQAAQWHIVGYTVFQPPDKCYLHPFEAGEPFVVKDNVQIIPTPGHTMSDVSVIVENVVGYGAVVIAGDLFEREEDVLDEKVWLEAGSEDPKKQRENRLKVAGMADWIIPGHGKMFKVDESTRTALKKQLDESLKLITGQES